VEVLGCLHEISDQQSQCLQTTTGPLTNLTCIAVEEGGLCGTTAHSELIGQLVEKRKASFTNRKDLLMGVDWIEEAIRRISDAILKGSSLSTVSMKNPLRQRKVSQGTHQRLYMLTLSS